MCVALSNTGTHVHAMGGAARHDMAILVAIEAKRCLDDAALGRTRCYLLTQPDICMTFANKANEVCCHSCIMFWGLLTLLEST
jgi:hypothetical protein